MSAGVLNRPLARPAAGPWLVAIAVVIPDVHGGARYDDRQRRAALHRGRTLFAGDR